MIRWLAVLLAALIVSACTVNFRSPKVAFSKVEKAERRNEEVSTAYNTSVFRWPGFTVSVAGTYLPGRKTHLQPNAPEFLFERNGIGSYTLNIGAESECRASPTAKRLLSDALAKLWDYSGGFPSKGQTDMHIVGNDIRATRYNVSLLTGRKYHLTYWTPCIDNDADAALFFAATIALHESTHASLGMVDGESRDAFERERTAVGAEACLYLAVRSLDESFTRQHKELLNRFNELQESQVGTTHIELPSLCKAWMATISSARPGGMPPLPKSDY
ncbi:hypothetical protein [Dyella sp.]|uniref:hypothetical protein n=1 Tax=Dyella sp. TaxID=1869338 RepID=UPI002D76B86C|nr:hypothetical protein [Dyella sp.]HET7332791.1 hypothetical protein [Dyella sp.]